MAIDEAPPNPESTAFKDIIQYTNGALVFDVAAGLATLNISKFEGKWVWLKAEGAAGERIGYNAWRSPAPTQVDQIGANVDPVLTAAIDGTACDALETGTRIRRFVLPEFGTLRVIGSAASLVLRVSLAQYG